MFSPVDVLWQKVDVFVVDVLKVVFLEVVQMGRPALIYRHHIPSWHIQFQYETEYCAEKMLTNIFAGS
jgi:hypothetical protein